MIDMADLPPMDLIEELTHVGLKVNRKANPEVFKEISDLVSMLVAASAREPIQMLHEIMIRDQTMLLTSELKQILSESSYDDEKPHNSETENG
jgi:hypothetical protein